MHFPVIIRVPMHIWDLAIRNHVVPLSTQTDCITYTIKDIPISEQIKRKWLSTTQVPPWQKIPVPIDCAKKHFMTDTCPSLCSSITMLCQCTIHANQVQNTRIKTTYTCVYNKATKIKNHIHVLQSGISNSIFMYQFFSINHVYQVSSV